jgi:hypothetical protein
MVSKVMKSDALMSGSFFIYGLFNDTVSISDCKVLNGRMIREWQTGKETDTAKFYGKHILYRVSKSTQVLICAVT